MLKIIFSFVITCFGTYLNELIKRSESELRYMWSLDDNLEESKEEFNRPEYEAP